MGFDILNDFKKNGVIESSDRVYNNETKRKVLLRYTELSKQYNIQFFNGDNLVSSEYGNGCECCGTGILRNHKIWGGCTRAKCFPSQENYSTEFGKCFVNFTRNKNYANKTLDEICSEQLQDKKNNQNETLF